MRTWDVLIARLTYREPGFQWPSHWGGCAPTSSAEGSLFPLQGRLPSSSWVPWHSLESQNALQPASWWLPELEPAVPECVEDGSLVRVSDARALRDYVPIWEGHVGSCHTEDALHKAFTSTPPHLPTTDLLPFYRHGLFQGKSRQRTSNEDPDLVYTTIFVVIRNWGKKKQTKQNFPVIGDWLSKISLMKY